MYVIGGIYLEILFVTTRNIATTCGELRLIKNRAMAMRDQFGIDSIFVSYIDKKRVEANYSGSVDKEFKVNYITYDKTKPYTFFKNLKQFHNKVIETLRNNPNIKVVIISGVISQRLLKKIKSIDSNIKIILDIHGATEEGIEYKSNKNIIYSRTFYLYSNYIFRKQLEYCDALMVVSNALKEHLIKKYPEIAGLKFFIIHCAGNIGEINIQKYYKSRQYWRKKLKIDEDECLFVYSGGASKWQMVNESVHLFLEIKDRLPFNSKLLVMSHKIDDIKLELQVNSRDIIFESFNASIVPEVLCASDFAFMLRENKITNNVAFPNKFVEYLISGNQIICTPYVFDVVELINNDIGYIYSGDIDELERFVIKNFGKPRVWDSYNNVINKVSFNSTLKELYEYISLQQ